MTLASATVTFPGPTACPGMLRRQHWEFPGPCVPSLPTPHRNLPSGRADHPPSAQPGENLTLTVRALAGGKFSWLTLMLWAKDEGDPRAWKRFDDNTELQVTYVPRPGVPTNVGLIPGYGRPRTARQVVHGAHLESPDLVAPPNLPTFAARRSRARTPCAGTDGVGGILRESSFGRFDGHRST